MYIDIEQLFLWAMCLMRLGAMIFWIPTLSGKSVPARVKVALALLMAATLYPLLDGTVTIPLATIDLVIFMFKELMVGALMGMAVRMIFFAVEFAGHVIAQEAGLSMSAAFDPNTQGNSSTVTTLLYYLTLLLFLAGEMHYPIIHSFVRSYAIVPMGMVFPGVGGMQNFVQDTLNIFSLGMQMAAPIVALNFVINLTFAVLGKAAPKINVFITSFAVKIIASLILLGAILGLIVEYLYWGFQRTPEQMLQYLLP